jgi:arylsulfatase A-like enzyme
VSRRGSGRGAARRAARRTAQDAGDRGAAADPDEGRTAHPPLPARRVLLLAVAFGLAFGLLEAAPLTLAQAMGLPIRVSTHVPWMVPLADTVLFLGAGGLLALLGARWPRLRSRAVVLGAFVGLGSLALLLVVEAVADWAMLVLAAGLGVQAARMAEGRVGRWLLRWPLRASPVLALLVAVLGAAVFVRESAAEDAALAALPDAAADRPNLLLLILDTVRASSLGLHGGADHVSPRLDRLASRAAVFDHALAPSPWTLPSHATMFTGHWPSELGAEWEAPLGDDAPTLAEALAARGYATAGFVANLLNASSRSGLARGFARYDDYDPSLGQTALASSIVRALAYNDAVRRLLGWHELLDRKTAPEIGDAFLDWLNDAPEGRPWFAFLNYYDAHEPHFPPDSLVGPRAWNRFEHRGGIATGGNAFVPEKWTLTPAERRLHRSAYEAAITRLDRALGALIDELEARGELERTVVVITSDHGEQLGERGLFDHNNSLYLPALHVPLLVLLPGGEGAGRRITRTVSLRDLPATLLELAGAGPELPGVSLSGLWRGEEVEVSPAVSHLTRGFVEQPGAPILRGSTPEMHSLVRWPFHYIRNGDGTDELYGYGETSPSPEHNLAGNPVADSVLMELRGILYRTVTGRPVPENMPIVPASGAGPATGPSRSVARDRPGVGAGPVAADRPPANPPQRISRIRSAGG